MNATAWGYVYSNNRLKKHTAIIASITVGNFKRTRHRFFFECTGSDVEKVYPT